jgi:2-C-methyl-D-erythritol 4-phosphate cytidylyltransferase
VSGPRVCGILLAAGMGARFGMPKQFERVGSATLCELALRVVRASCDHTTLVLPRDWPGAGEYRTLADAVVPGGRSRSESVRHALDAVPAAAEVVVVHQAANPLASLELFGAVIRAVRDGADAAVPGLRLVDVARRVHDGWIVEDVGRDDLVVVQTPGAFRAEVLRSAHRSGADAVEDTELVRACGYDVAVVPGEPLNLHVTTPEDLHLVRLLVEHGGASGGG